MFWGEGEEGSKKGIGETGLISAAFWSPVSLLPEKKRSSSGSFPKPVADNQAYNFCVSSSFISSPPPFPPKSPLGYFGKTGLAK